ncbi:hypothetical protein [Nocardia huaxiensis]|uniref:Uncharacterized protein n=1 Tax=Nocardia huaxiensis TaxID=2755382 RepID=A0A7D6VN78_9NOCA|nr:hypothetical protein [Nocardia huaxiensis]QLY33470.1 hypothetical protein H0264_15660 [Nocardia huaxiensis]UFS99619.1 hypothetical protein LPY97_17900 [Nocardia huaxiensis]
MFKKIAADLVVAFALLAAGYHAPTINDPYHCLPHVMAPGELVQCLDDD